MIRAEQRIEAGEYRLAFDDGSGVDVIISMHTLHGGAMLLFESTGPLE